MADDFDLERADHVADETDLIHRAAGRHERRGHREERIARADRVDHVLGEGRDGVDDPAALIGDAAVLAVGDDDLRAIDVALDQPARDVADLGYPVADGEPRFRRIDADVVGARISGDQVVAHIGAVGLGVDRQEARLAVSASIDRWRQTGRGRNR